jgi:predicted nucleic acid-binding Zn ribbon protein
MSQKHMRRKNHQTRLQSIGEILFSAFKRRGMAAKLEENAVLKLWPKAVGEQIAAQTQPDNLRNGTLFVKTTSSVWVQQLHFMKDEIRQKLNELSGKDAIKEIRFSVGHAISNNKIAMEAEMATAKKSFLKDRDKKMIAECTASLADPELAAILKRVMKTEINRRRRMQLTSNR